MGKDATRGNGRPLPHFRALTGARHPVRIGADDSRLPCPLHPMLPGASSTLRPSARSELARLAAMMVLFFLVVCAVGILRPIKNSLALDGLGATDFYKVYLVSAVVIVFVPLYNRLSDRLSWRWLIPAVSLFFALQLVVLRWFYVEGSTAFGLVFYGWYDLFASALVTQFFMATQLFVNARLAKRAYPVVIAGGALGATLGGAITALLAVRIGTPNLMLVAAGLILVFSIAMPLVWQDPAKTPKPRRAGRRGSLLAAGELRALLSNPHVRLIAGMVLLMIVIKQLVDYQFNTLSKEVFQERDAISAFQGRFNAATQWLPLVAVAALQPLLRRWGIALAVLLLPAAMLLGSAGLLVFWGLGAAVAAKAAETSLRYSAERAGREILYVPIPDDIKLRAKTWIDVAIEKGVGKLLGALLIFVLLSVTGYRTIALASVLLSVVWLLMAVRVKHEYVRSLAQSLDAGFASLGGGFASVADATSTGVVRRALSGDEAQVAFTLDLVAQGRPQDIAALVDELHALLEHPAARIRRRALNVLAATGALAPGPVRLRLLDDDAGVREAAVRALQGAGGTNGLIEELLASDHARVRTAVLACLARDEMGDEAIDIARRVYERNWPKHTDPDAAGRLELALAVVALRLDDAAALVEPLLDDADPQVASTALRSVARTGSIAVYPRLIAALGRPATREAARDALAEQGARAVPRLLAVLLDPAADRAVRRNIPSVLARIPTHESIEALVRGALAAETDQLLDARAVRALSRLRSRHPRLAFDADLVRTFIGREVTVTSNLLETGVALDCAARPDPIVRLLQRALREAGEARRENVFRCLGLLYEPAGMHRCWYALARGDGHEAASAIEWLEHTVDRALFLQLAPVLGLASLTGARRRNPLRTLGSLAGGDDAWLACCARRVAAALFATRSAPPEKGTAMDLVDKVFLLQRIDLLRDAQTDHLALLAAVADEVDAPTGVVLANAGEPAHALFVVVSGTVRLIGAGLSLVAAAGEAFGTAALIDEAPATLDVVTAEPCRLLRIARDDFRDLLTDHPEIAITMLQGLGRRVRALAGPAPGGESLHALL